MKLGFCLPQLGPAAGPEALGKATQRAEALGYQSLWVLDRLLYPLNPKTPYPATPDGSLPEVYKRVFDPLATLTYVSAHTKSIEVGTSVLDMPFYNPVVLARHLTTLDILSGGRLRVGLGQGWSQDEFEAAAAKAKERAPRADEFLQVLKAIWTTDPVEFRGRFFQVPRSHIHPKPVQKPHPPIILAAFSESALKRVANHADGWNPVGIPVEGMKQMFENIKTMAAQAGRDPGKLQLVVRANLALTERPIEKDRFIFTGSPEQIQNDIRACRQIGADELVFDANFMPAGESLDGLLSTMETIRRLS